MSSKTWKCLRIFSKSFEDLNKVTENIIVLMRKLKPKHVELYFFNRYANSKKDEYFINLGLINSDKKATDELDKLLKERDIHVKPYDCEIWEVNGFPIDFIKCVSCELYEKIREHFEDKPLTLDQLFYLTHFLMNQLNLGYENELKLYNSLARSIQEKLRKN
jgi:hypothetical protein